MLDKFLFNFLEKKKSIHVNTSASSSSFSCVPEAQGFHEPICLTILEDMIE